MSVTTDILDQDVLHPRHFQFESASVSEKAGDNTSLTLEELERRHIVSVLAAENGHVERAATRLGIPRSTLYYKVKLLGLSAQ